jgi:hypothetical protein
VTRVSYEVALRQQLKEAAEEAVCISKRLLSVITEKNSSAEKRTGKLDHSQPPWNGAIAHAYLDLHAYARELEALYRLAAGFPARPRGGSDPNTENALKAVLRLAEKVDDKRVADATRMLCTWCNRARMVLGELEPPRRLPRAPGKSEPRCPYCKKMTLRSQLMAGIVRCINPDCRDNDGKRPLAKMEWSEFSNDWVLAWQDGTAGVET